MIDYGTRHTDLALKRLEARLRAVYRQAEKDIAAKTEDYWKRHAARDEKYRQQVKDGKLSKEDYEAWQRGQVFQGEQWKSKRQSIEDVLYDADSTAMRMINDGKMDVFTAGANYMGYELEQHGRIDTGFNLYDGPTVTRLLKDDPQILPKARVKKEKAYVWYNKLVNNCVLQGIIQGESINEIAARIGRTTGERTENAMKRNALTAYTGAQNAGRIEGMKQAQQMGIDVKKRWIATMDSRTRDAHRDLDGQVQDVDKPFKSSLGDIMYPGDPKAKPGNVYNCHCAVGSAYPKYPAAMTRRDAETGKVVGDMTYREWEAMKRIEGATPIDIPDQWAVVKGRDISETWQRRPDQFDFEINDVINAQGFDGRPRVVDADEFDRVVQDSGFIAQRSYSAPDQETLDAYRHQLYDGEWYVDCSTGGAQYGQGMYCAADYNGKLTDGIKAEMEHYRNLGESRYETYFDAGAARERKFEMAEAAGNKVLANGGTMQDARAAYDKIMNTPDLEWAEKYAPELLPQKGVSYTETLTLAPDAKIVTWREINDIRMGNLDMEYRTREIERIVASHGFTQDEATFVKYNLGTGVSWGEVDAAARRLTPERRNELVDEFYRIGEEATRRYDEEHDRRVSLARIYQEKYHDIGSLAAALGYDAINAENHGQSGSYTVILNRTKVIFRRP
jgi:hypothetical protein